MTDAPKRSAMQGRWFEAVLTLAALGFLAAIAWRWRALDWHDYVWLLGSLASFAIRLPHGRRFRDSKLTVTRRPLIEKLTLTGMFLTFFFLPVAYLATGAPALLDYEPPVWAEAVGAALIAPYLWLFWRSHADLGRNWSPGLDLREGQTLVTEGVYRRVRHPMYAAIWLGALAQPLLIQNWLAGAAVVPVFLAMYLTRLPMEEAMMRERFGDAWDAYAARTGALFPKL